jgi:prolyl oligopeptidase
MSARRDDVVDVMHGVAVPDPYRWLEDSESQETRAWVAEQNARTRAALDRRPDRATWHARLIELMTLPIAQSYAPRGDSIVGVERPARANQSILVVRSANDRDQPARVLVDPAAQSADGTTAIDWFSVSPDGALVAYGTSDGGSEDSTLRIVEVGSGRHLPDEIRRCRFSGVAWWPGREGFVYGRYPEHDEYNRRLFGHRPGVDAPDGCDDDLVWADLPTPETWAGATTSLDGRWLLVQAQVGWSRHDVHLLDRHSGEWRTLIKGVDAQTTFEFAAAGLVGVTTLGAPRGRVVVASFAAPEVDSWRTLVPEGDGVRGRFEVVGDELWSVVTENAIDRIERHRLDTGELIGTVDGLGVSTVTEIVADPAADEPGSVFVLTTGFDAPSTLWRWTASGGVERWFGAEPGASTPVLTATQHTVRSLDGTEIGVFLIHAPATAPGPQTPTILTGYGGFAISETPEFSPMIAAWCESGGLYAVAGLRGGFEHGETWHQAGRRANKQNVFDDFHAVANWLVAEQYTSRPKLAIAGGSNGGLLVGAALTQRPDAYRAVWCAVPLLDMVRFPLFRIARLWTDEYGDPDVAEEFGWLHAYSPYHHVVEGTAYPAVLFTAAEGDGRVDPLHARKMAALMQHAAADRDGRPILFREDGKAGHGPGKPVAMQADERADVLTFLAWQLGHEAGAR